MADSGGGEQGIFVTIGGTSVPLQEALDAAIPKLGELQDALRRTEEAGSGGGGGGGFLGGGFGGGFLGMLGDAGHSLDFLGGALGGAAEKLMAFGSQMWAVTGGMVAFNALSDATQKVQEFADSLVQLNITAENTQFGWGFMFGDMQRAPGGGPDSPFTDVSGKSQKLYDWAQQYSMQIPFTRFDEMGAISMLGTVPRDDNGNNLTPEDVEHYLPIIADIASTWGKTAYGGRGVDLNQAAYIIQQAVEGRSIMLKRDLKINPEDLIKYGLDASGTGTGIHINDKSTLLPALEKWAEAHHLSGGENDSQGAARAAAHQTFSGEWSSFIDRIQLFEQTGGQELFKDLKGDLEGISSWWDQHKPEMNALAKLFGQDLGAGLHAAGQGFQGFADGLQKSGLGQAVLDDMQKAAAWLADPKNQKEIEHLGEILGDKVGKGLLAIGQAADGAAKSVGGLEAILESLSKASGLDHGENPWAKFASDVTEALKEVGLVGKDLGAIFGDDAKIIDDLSKGNWAQALKDEGQAMSDFGTFVHDSVTGDPKAPVKPGPVTNAIVNGSRPPNIPPVTPTQPGNQTGPAGAWRWYDSTQANHDAVGVDGTTSDTSNQDAFDFTNLGQQHASAYLTAFNSTVKDQTGPDLVQAFTDGVNRQLSNGSGDVLASRLATFIDQRTRQAIADALANMDLTSNGSRTQAGGPGHQAFTPY